MLLVSGRRVILAGARLPYDKRERISLPAMTVFFKQKSSPVTDLNGPNVRIPNRATTVGDQDCVSNRGRRECCLIIRIKGLYVSGYSSCLGPGCSKSSR